MLEKVLVHMDLQEVRLNMKMLEEVDQLVAGKLVPSIDCLELERIYLAVGRSKEVHYMAMGRVEWGAASCFGQFVV